MIECVKNYKAALYIPFGQKEKRLGTSPSYNIVSGLIMMSIKA